MLRFILSNPSITELLGCSPDQHISKKVNDAYPKVAKQIFAQIIFEHSVIQNNCIAIHCELPYKRHLYGKPFSFTTRNNDLNVC